MAFSIGSLRYLCAIILSFTRVRSNHCAFYVMDMNYGGIVRKCHGVDKGLYQSYQSPLCFTGFAQVFLIRSLPFNDCLFNLCSPDANN